MSQASKQRRIPSQSSRISSKKKYSGAEISNQTDKEMMKCFSSSKLSEIKEKENEDLNVTNSAFSDAEERIPKNSKWRAMSTDSRGDTPMKLDLNSLDLGSILKSQMGNYSPKTNLNFNKNNIMLPQEKNVNTNTNIVKTQLSSAEKRNLMLNFSQNIDLSHEDIQALFFGMSQRREITPVNNNIQVDEELRESPKNQNQDENENKFSSWNEIRVHKEVTFDVKGVERKSSLKENQQNNASNFLSSFQTNITSNNLNQQSIHIPPSPSRMNLEDFQKNCFHFINCFFNKLREVDEMKNEIKRLNERTGQLETSSLNNRTLSLGSNEIKIFTNNIQIVCSSVGSNNNLNDGNIIMSDSENFNVNFKNPQLPNKEENIKISTAINKPLPRIEERANTTVNAFKPSSNMTNKKVNAPKFPQSLKEIQDPEFDKYLTARKNQKNTVSNYNDPFIKASSPEVEHPNNTNIPYLDNQENIIFNQRMEEEANKEEMPILIEDEEEDLPAVLPEVDDEFDNLLQQLGNNKCKNSGFGVKIKTEDPFKYGKGFTNKGVNNKKENVTKFNNQSNIFTDEIEEEDVKINKKDLLALVDDEFDKFLGNIKVNLPAKNNNQKNASSFIPQNSNFDHKAGDNDNLDKIEDDEFDNLLGMLKKNKPSGNLNLQPVNNQNNQKPKPFKPPMKKKIEEIIVNNSNINSSRNNINNSSNPAQVMSDFTSGHGVNASYNPISMQKYVNEFEKDYYEDDLLEENDSLTINNIKPVKNSNPPQGKNNQNKPKQHQSANNNNVKSNLLQCCNNLSTLKMTENKNQVQAVQRVAEQSQADKNKIIPVTNPNQQTTNKKPSSVVKINQWSSEKMNSKRLFSDHLKCIPESKKAIIPAEPTNKKFKTSNNSFKIIENTKNKSNPKLKMKNEINIAEVNEVAVLEHQFPNNSNYYIDNIENCEFLCLCQIIEETSRFVLNTKCQICNNSLVINKKNFALAFSHYYSEGHINPDSDKKYSEFFSYQYKIQCWKYYMLSKLNNDKSEFTIDNILSNLIGKYKLIFEQGKSSFLTRVAEKDSSINKNMILLLLSVKEILNQGYILEFSDGYKSAYSEIPIINPIYSLLNKNIIIPGMKLNIGLAKIDKITDDFKIFINIYYNSITKADCNSKLGPVKDTKFLKKNLANLREDGGEVSLVDVIVLKKYDYYCYDFSNKQKFSYGKLEKMIEMQNEKFEKENEKEGYYSGMEGTKAKKWDENSNNFNNNIIANDCRENIIYTFKIVCVDSLLYYNYINDLGKTNLATAMDNSNTSNRDSSSLRKSLKSKLARKCVIEFQTKNLSLFENISVNTRYNFGLLNLTKNSNKNSHLNNSHNDPKILRLKANDSVLINETKMSLTKKDSAFSSMITHLAKAVNVNIEDLEVSDYLVNNHFNFSAMFNEEVNFTGVYLNTHTLKDKLVLYFTNKYNNLVIIKLHDEKFFELSKLLNSAKNNYSAYNFKNLSLLDVCYYDNITTKQITALKKEKKYEKNFDEKCVVISLETNLYSSFKQNVSGTSEINKFLKTKLSENKKENRIYDETLLQEIIKCIN